MTIRLSLIVQDSRTRKAYRPVRHRKDRRIHPCGAPRFMMHKVLERETLAPSGLVKIGPIRKGAHKSFTQIRNDPDGGRNPEIGQEMFSDIPPRKDGAGNRFAFLAGKPSRRLRNIRCQNSTPCWDLIPFRKGCLIIFISETKSAASMSSGFAPRPVITTWSMGGRCPTAFRTCSSGTYP